MAANTNDIWIEFLSHTITEISFGVYRNSNDGLIIATANGQTEALFPMEFCELSLQACARKSDNAKFKNGKSNLNKQVKLFTVFKTDITQTIEKYKRWAVDYPTLKKYDFDSFMRQVDVAVSEAKLNIEIKLLNSQVYTNENVIKTNKRMILLIVITSIIAGISAYADFKSMSITDETQSLQSHINTQQQLVATQKRELQKQGHQIKLLERKLDSVAHQQLTNSLKPKHYKGTK